MTKEMKTERYNEKQRIKAALKQARRVRDAMRNILNPQPPELKYPPMRAVNPQEDKAYWDSLGARVEKGK
jgi:hypothetical protein